MTTLTSKRSRKVSTLSKKRKAKPFPTSLWTVFVIAVLMSVLSVCFVLGTRGATSEYPLKDGISDVRPLELMTMRDPEHSGRYIVAQIGENGQRIIGSFTKTELANLEAGIDLDAVPPR